MRGISAEIGKAGESENLFRELKNDWNRLDILVNNVGTNIRKRALEYTLDEYEFLMRTNITSVFENCRQAYPLLKSAGQSAVVNIASVAALTHLRTGAPYAMSKAAMLQLTRNLALEWAADHIRVNAVAPWYIRTPLAAPVLNNPDYLAEVLTRTPGGTRARSCR